MSADQTSAEAQREKLGAEIGDLERMLEGLERQPQGSSTARMRANYEGQLAEARQRYAELSPPLTHDDGVAREPQRPPRDDDRAPATADNPRAGSSSAQPAHPIEAVANQFVRLVDVLQLGAVDDTGFAENTAAALREACRVPVRLTEGGDPVIGPASFVLAELSLSARSLREEPVTLGEALVAHFVRDAPARRTELADLTAPPSPSDQAPTTDAPAAGRGIGLAIARMVAAGSSVGADPAGTEDVQVQRAVVDPEMTRVLADAARLARDFQSTRGGVDVTLVLIAALRSEAGQAAFRDLGLIHPDPQQFFVGLSDVVFQFLRRPNGPFWNAPEGFVAEAVLSLGTVRIRIAPQVVSSVRFVADVPETSLDADRLGMADDARSLAEVMCLREPGPPLAIGLFGDWGSGKSTFMNLIESAVTELTARTAGDEVGRRTFVSRVVHIRFNAWHYNDANLWASITSEFFAQLRSGGAGPRDRKTYESLVGEVLARVESLDGDAARAAIEAAAARGEAIDHQRSLDRLEDRRRHIVGAALSETAREMLPDSRPGELAKVERALQALGRPVDVSAEKRRDDPDAAKQAVANMAAREIGNIAESSNAVLGVLGTVLKAARKRIVSYAMGGAIAVYALALVWALRADLLRATAAVWATIIPAVYLAWRAYQDVQPIILAVTRYLRRKREQSAEIDREQRETHQKLDDARRRTQDAEQVRARTESDAARFKGASPDRVFDYYLNVSADTQQFEQQLGTISRVRRVFEQLNAIYKERQAIRPGAAPAAAIPQVSAFDIDRIVLYVDDLDRCQFDQVVRVLEAVHLLLAFPLFVVVVGVDPRWLQKSLLAAYKDQLGDVAHGTVDRATVQDYLEKIFQIPIQLKQLSARQSTELRPYLRAVAGPIEAPPPEAAQQSPQAGSAGGATRLRPVEVVLRPAPESAGETATRVTLRKDELEMIEQLAPFVGKSPRTIKRFMNVYRLIRGRRRGEALEAFLSGANGTPPEFVACQLWLALDMGLPPRLAADYAALLNDATMPDFPDFVKGEQAFEIKWSPPGKAIMARLRATLDAETRTRHADAINAALARYPAAAGRWSILRTTELEVRRFSLPTTQAPT
ncbi:MAG TPA: P-loop NTPase fold protein [Vicinamibacterales bacterium]|nr:P-loop NTPase fold protein [Vicinamibacterales bacterium]